MLLSVEVFEVEVEDVDGGECVLGGSRSGPDRVDCSSVVQHADVVVIVLVDIREGDVEL